MLPEITFILPTQNRGEYVSRAVASCLATERATVFRCKVLVIVGLADIGTEAILKSQFGNDNRVEVIPQKANEKGFMNACFLGVSLLTTEYATFMYDDDVLSPYLGELYAKMINEGRPFAMGLGKSSPPDERIVFSPLVNVRSADWWTVLMGYYRDSRFRNLRMPVSPICCLTTSVQLRRWVQYVLSFVAQDPGRRDLVLSANLGGDLMIFLSGLLDNRSGAKPLFSDEAVAQFSRHPTSMTVTYDSLKLKIGYWIAKNWACEYLVQIGEHRKAQQLASYLVVTGMADFWRARRLGKRDLSSYLIVELHRLRKVLGARGFVDLTPAALDLLVGKLRHV